MLQIYNTFTQQKEPFKPLMPNEVSIYACGITVYDYCHLGHARLFVAFDVMVRYLRASGWNVRYVRNITDIDDKIIARASVENQSIEELTTFYINAMHQDMESIFVKPADYEPRATEYIDKMQSMISMLEQKGYAYQGTHGDVYFQVDKFSDYGKLAHKNLDQLQAGTRVEVVKDKHSALDFVLWKKAKPQEPSWSSPWGEGRPGWHIECSAMSTDILGETFDIHGGGVDLVFPHHENERAQSECATGKTFSNYWLHVGFVQINKEKMSKSLNNFFTIREILKEYDAEVVRYFLVASHYRSPVNFSKEQLEQAKSTLDGLYNALRGIENYENGNCDESYIERFHQAMNDDFNTPIALSVIFDCMHALNMAKERQLEEEQLKLAATLVKMTQILGLINRTPQSYFQGDDCNIERDVLHLIAKRNEARQQKKWQIADAVRQQLADMGIVIEDTPQGTSWKKI